MQRFTDLLVWRRSHALALSVYRASASFPREERFGLTSQLRRAVVSVPTNIAEGVKRQSTQEYARFVNVAEASLAETQYLLMLSRDLGYMTQAACRVPLAEAAEIAGMLHRLRSRVEVSSRPVGP